MRPAASLAADADTVAILDGQVSASVDGSNKSSYLISGNGSVTMYEAYDPSTSFSTTSAASSSTQIAFTFDQALESLDNSTGGTADLTFLALSGGLFSITDPDPVCNYEGIAADAFDAFRADETTQTYLYDTNNGGRLTGTLTAGDLYAFEASASVSAQADPSLTYDPSISFSSNTAVTPEPSSLALLGTGALGMVRRRLSGKGARRAC